MRTPIGVEDAGKIGRRTAPDGTKYAIVAYRGSDGKVRRIQRKGDTWPQAEDHVRKALEDAFKLFDAELSRESTVSELCELWLEEYADVEDRAIGTLTTYRTAIRGPISRGIGNVPLRELNVPRVDRFIKANAKQSAGIRTVLRQAFAYAVRQGAMEYNPMLNVSKRPRKTRNPVVALTAEDAASIQEAMHAYDVAVDGRGRVRDASLEDLAMMFAATGARTGEVFGLRWADFDFEAAPPTVDIRGTIVPDENGSLMYQQHPKSEAGKRGLLLPRFAVDMLMERRVNAFSEWVFPSGKGGMRWPNNMRRQWREALADTPYASATPKAFRKAVASLMARELSPLAARNQLGHADERTTEKFYVEQPARIGPDGTSLLDAFFSKRRVKGELSE